MLIDAYVAGQRVNLGYRTRMTRAASGRWTTRYRVPHRPLAPGP